MLDSFVSALPPIIVTVPAPAFCDLHQRRSGTNGWIDNCLIKECAQLQDYDRFLFQAGFADAIREQVRRTPYPPHGHTVAVELTAFGDRAFVKGGVTLAMDAFLEEAVLRRCGGLSADGDEVVVLNS